MALRRTVTCSPAAYVLAMLNNDDGFDEASTPLERAVLATLGPSGRMIALSKQHYGDAHPDHVVVFNANVCVSPARKVWHGDVDLTRDESMLHELARRTGAIVYVLYEHDGRFANERRPLVAEAVFSVTPSGHTKFQYRRIEREADGRLCQRTVRGARG